MCSSHDDDEDKVRIPFMRATIPSQKYPLYIEKGRSGCQMLLVWRWYTDEGLEYSNSIAYTAPISHCQKLTPEDTVIKILAYDARITLQKIGVLPTPYTFDWERIEKLEAVVREC